MTMKKWWLIAALAASPWAGAASILDFDVWMRAIDRRSVTVQKSITAQDFDSAKADARELERYYTLMEAFFAKDRQAEDAVRQSAEGRALAAAIPAALDKQDYATATQSAVTLARACNDCHDNHKPFK
ncbi:MAG: hypothetical protein ABI605_12725 [Rhizobacter sp.]